MRNLSISKFHNNNVRKLDVSTRWRDARQHEIYHSIMRKAENQFVNHMIITYRPRNPDQLCVVWHFIDEMISIKLTNILSPNSTGQNRNVMHVGFCHHRFHCSIDIMINKLVLNVSIEY